MSLFTMRRSAPTWVATSRITASTSGSCSKNSAGTPFLKIPAFSRAICALVVPSSLVWSRSMAVTMLTSGVITLVESRRPPRPTSTTAMSTACSAKCANAIAVISSKNVACSPSFSAALATVRVISTKSVLPIWLPSMVTRSRMSMRCGLV